MERNMDALATYKDNWNDFTLTASVGGNVLYSRGSSISNSSKAGSGLIIPFVYTVQNIAKYSALPIQIQGAKRPSTVFMQWPIWDGAI